MLRPLSETTYFAEGDRSEIGLSLSGGGYRAALFHLGALRRLNELGILAKLSTISSVSGGSIVSAHLATRVSWPLSGPIPSQDWDTKVAEPFRAFCRKNIRSKPILEGLVLRWRTNSEWLERQYHKYLTQLDLVDLPTSPNFVFCATDLSFGVNWTFENNKVGDYQAGYLTPTPKHWPLSLAVAASSCFPPVFKPLRPELKIDDLRPGKFPDGPQRRKCIEGLCLNDGGVYDNLGLEPIWTTHGTVLSSDGGALFDIWAKQGFFWEVKRDISIPENQALTLRKRWLVANFKLGQLNGTYWGVGGSPSRYGACVGYSKDLAVQRIAAVRTDLDSFSDAEIAVLENHGYLLADAAITKHVSSLTPSPVPPLVIPHREWMDEVKVSTALAGSDKRKIFGRF